MGWFPKFWKGAESGYAKKMDPVIAEIATTRDGRDITRGYISSDLIEQPDDAILQTRGGGDYAIYRDVLRDDHVKSALQQRIHAVLSRPWEVKAGGDSPIDIQAADHLRGQLDAISFDAVTEKMLYGIFYGVAFAEVMWASDGKMIRIDDIKARDRRRFGFDGSGRLVLKTTAKPQGEVMPDNKFWVFAQGADHSDAPYGLGLAHWLYWLVWFKRNGVKFWATDLERFGSPAMLGRFPRGTSAEDQAKLLECLRAIQRDSAVVVPDGMLVELLESRKSGGASHGEFVSMMNAAILVVIIGQTASTQGTPGKLGNDKNQSDVRGDIVKADADLICSSFNASVAKWLTEYNFPGAALPQVWRVFDDEDLARRIVQDEKIHGMGFDPELEYIHETYGGRWTKRTATPPANFAEPTADETPIPALTDAMADQAAPAWAKVLAEVKSIVAGAEHDGLSMAQLRDVLLASYAELSTDELAEVMRLGFAVANLAGISDVEDDASAE